MFFKGTKSRSQKQIAYEIDSLGGDLNAFTSKETTTFYVKVLDEYLPKAVDLLTDIFVNSTLPDDEIEKEKMVIMEEIKLSEDAPDELIHDLFSEVVWGKEGLGQRILGRIDTVGRFQRQDLLNYIKTYYRAGEIVVSCSGRVDDSPLLDRLQQTLGHIDANSVRKPQHKPLFRYETAVFERDLAEVHLCVGVEGIHQQSPYRYAMLLLNTVVGGGVSSRLFQKVREEQGLAYTVYSFASSYHDSGVFCIYLGTSPEKLQKALECIRQEVFHLTDNLTEDELQRAKQQLKGSLFLSLESSTGRMSNIARQEIYYGRYYSPKEIAEAIEAVTLNEIQELAEMLFSDKRLAVVALGPVDRDSIV